MDTWVSFGVTLAAWGRIIGTLMIVFGPRKKFVNYS